MCSALVCCRWPAAVLISTDSCGTHLFQEFWLCYVVTANQGHGGRLRAGRIPADWLLMG